MAAQSFGGLFESLVGIDFFTGILPFVITYTVFFFVLRYISANLLFPQWDDNKPDQFAALLAIAFAFFTANFILNQPWAAGFFSQYIGRLTIIIVGLLGLLTVLGFVGMDLDSSKTRMGWVLALIVLAAFSVSGGLTSILPTGQGQAIQGFSDLLAYSIDSGLIFILLIVGLLYYTMRDPGSGSDDSMQWFTPFPTPGDSEGSSGGGDSSDG